MPLSVYYDGKLIGGAVIQNGELVFTAGQLTTPDIPDCYGTIGKQIVNSSTRYGLFLYKEANNPFLTATTDSNGNARIASKNDIYIGIDAVLSPTGITLNKSGDINIRAFNSNVEVNSKTLNLSGIFDLKPTEETTGFSGTFTHSDGNGSFSLTFNKGILTKIETGG